MQTQPVVGGCDGDPVNAACSAGGLQTHNPNNNQLFTVWNNKSRRLFFFCGACRCGCPCRCTSKEHVHITYVYVYMYMYMIVEALSGHTKSTEPPSSNGNRARDEPRKHVDPTGWPFRYPIRRDSRIAPTLSMSLLFFALRLSHVRPSKVPRLTVRPSSPLPRLGETQI